MFSGSVSIDRAAWDTLGLVGGKSGATSATGFINRARANSNVDTCFPSPAIPSAMDTKSVCVASAVIKKMMSATIVCKYSRANRMTTGQNGYRPTIKLPRRLCESVSVVRLVMTAAEPIASLAKSCCICHHFVRRVVGERVTLNIGDEMGSIVSESSRGSKAVRETDISQFLVYAHVTSVTVVKRDVVEI
ncbi:unnamed protein product [Somion occarium]|uniref:Uncharacterized protein n=1 Tax=Somion occarium TaxID=3059160 RepID=A0ABP1DU15_9APHY